MKKLYLKRMELEDKKEVLELINKMTAFGSHIAGLWYEYADSFENMFEKVKEHSEIIHESYEQSKPIKFQYLLFDEDSRLVGLFSIRPYLTRSLDETYGGNIGYSIRPSERRKGYAKEGLRLAVLECKRLNPNDPVMVCCSKDNIGSQKTILNNGGVLIEEKNALITKQKYLIY